MILLKDKAFYIVHNILKGPVAPGGSEVVFGGPYPGFTTPINPGATDKQKIMQTHIQVFKVLRHIAFIFENQF